MKSNDVGTLDNSVIYQYVPSTAARELFFYPLYLGHYYCDGNYSVNRSKFDSYLLMYVKSGSGFISSQKGLHHLVEGDLTLLNCYVPHQYYTKTGWEILWVHFDGPMAEKYYDYAFSKDRLIRPAANTPVLRRFEKLLDFFQSQTIADEVLLSKFLGDILTELLLPMEKDVGAIQQAALIDESIKYICENFDQELTIEMLARHAMLSPFHFTRVFKQETGITPHQYLINVRLDYSRYLLRTGELPIKEIAYRCGFASSGCFCTCFKKYNGLSPAEYRKQL